MSAGTINGTVTYPGTLSGKVIVQTAQTSGGNKVLKLDGVGDYAVISGLMDLSGSEITVQYWFRGGSIQSAVRQQSGGYIVAGWNGMHIVSNDGGTDGVTVGQNYNDGKWHQLLFTWKQNTPNGFATYMDGKPVASRDSSNSPIPNHNAPVYFGAFQGVSEFSEGRLDEIAIWKKALSPEEIAANWNKKLAGNEAGLTGYWTFDNGTVTDLSPNHFDGELDGDALIEEDGIPGLGGGLASTELAAAGTYSIPNLPDGAGYSVIAFLDVNANNHQDADEPFGAFSGNPFQLTGTKNGADITLFEKPRVTQQPTGGRFATGSSLTLKVKAEGTAPLTYAWIYNDVPLANGARISGVATDTLTVNNLTEADSGVYGVKVTNPYGEATGDVVPVLVVTGGVSLSGQITYAGTQTGKIIITAAQRSTGNKVLSLDGTGDSVATGITDLSGSEISIQYWFKGASLQSAVRQQSGSGYIVAGWSGLHILSNDGATGNGISVGAAATDGNWHHVVMTWKQGTVGGFASYLDGNLVTKRDSSDAPIPILDNPLYFGAYQGISEFTNGELDEIGVWNRALSASEIKAKWNRTLTGNEPGLIGYWDFNSGDASDKSPNGNNGELQGDASILDDEIDKLGASYSITLDSASAYTLDNIPKGSGYYLSAFLDVNGNNLQDAGEPSGLLPGNPLTLTANQSGLNILLTEPPRITSQPSRTRVVAGATAQFSVGAQGTDPLTYEWSREGVVLANDGRITGATSPNLSIANAKFSDAGSYRVKIKNAVGEVSSAQVDLAVDGGATVSGKITYAGTQTGKVYITASRQKGGNKVLALDGADSSVRTTLRNLAGSELSIQYWFKGSSVQSAVRQQSSGYVVAGWNGAHILSNDGGTSAGIAVGDTVTDGEWHHVFLTWKQGAADGFASYLDGHPVAKRKAGNNAIPNFDVAVYFGSFNGVAEFTNGELDEIGIWNRALSPSEVALAWNQPLLGLESGLIGYWDFNDGTISDKTSNGNNGTPIGGAAIIDDQIPGLATVVSQSLDAVGNYAISNLPLESAYTIRAFVDVNGNLIEDPDEPSGAFSGNPVTITANKADVDITLTEPPRITSQPSPLRVAPGQNAQFTVIADGTASLTYEWSHNGEVLANSARISGATDAQLEITGVLAADKGSYTVKVRNARAEVASRIVPLAVVAGGVSISGELKYAGELPGRIILKAETFKSGNKALNLDGTGDFVSIPALVDLSGEQITIQYWFKGSIIQSAVRQQSASDYLVAGWNGMHILSNDEGTAAGVAVGSATDGNWHNVAMTWKISELGGFASYLDGELVASRESGGGSIPFMDTPVYFGSFNGVSEFTMGQLDEIAIWNRALTASEVRDASTKILTGSEPGLIGFWNFDDGTLSDRTPNGFNGDFGGDAAIVDAQVSGLGGLVYIDELTQAGVFTMANVPVGQGYYVTAFIDENGNGVRDETESEVPFSSNPFDLSANKTGVVIDLGGNVSAPSLAISKQTDKLMISWDSSAQGFTLESTDELVSGSWTAVAGVTGNTASITPSEEYLFFRLRKP